jgi:hypothetical protein
MLTARHDFAQRVAAEWYCAWKAGQLSADAIHNEIDSLTQRDEFIGRVAEDQFIRLKELK